MIKINFLFIIFCLNSIKSNSQIKVFENTKTGYNAGNGVLYTLPKTKLSVEAMFTKTLNKRDTLYDYAWLQSNKAFLQKYIDYDIVEALGKKNVFTSYALKDKDISIKTLAVADSSKVYFVESKKKLFKSSSIKFNFGNDYILQGASQTVEDKTFEMVTKAFSAVAGILLKMPGKILSSQNSLSIKVKDTPIKDDGFEKFDYSLTDKDEIRQDLLETLKKLETDYFNLRTRAIPIDDKDLFEKLLSENKAVRQEIIILLSYNTKEITVNSVFDIAPNAIDKKFQLFSFTDTAGIKPLLNSWQKGKYYYDVLTPGNAFDDGSFYWLELQPGQSLFTSLSHIPPGEITNYYRYNIPVLANAKVEYKKGNTIATNIRCYLPQYGEIGYLHTKFAGSTLELDPATGSLKNLSMDRKSKISSDNISNAGAAIEKGLEATDKNERLKKQLQNELDIITLKQKLEKAQKGEEE